MNPTMEVSLVFIGLTLFLNFSIYYLHHFNLFSYLYTRKTQNNHNYETPEN